MVDDGKEMVVTDLSRGGGDSTRGWAGWLFSGESVALRFFHWFLWSDSGRKSPPRLLLQISGRSLAVKRFKLVVDSSEIQNTETLDHDRKVGCLFYVFMFVEETANVNVWSWRGRRPQISHFSRSTIKGAICSFEEDV